MLREKIAESDRVIENLMLQLNSSKIVYAHQEQAQQSLNRISADLTNSKQIMTEVESKISFFDQNLENNFHEKPLNIRMKNLLQHLEKLNNVPALTLGCFSYGHVVAAKPNQNGFMELIRTCGGSPFYFVYNAQENPLVVKNGSFTNRETKFKLSPNNLIFGRIIYIEEKRNAKMVSNPLQLPIGAEYYCVYLESVEAEHLCPLFC